MIRLTPEEFKEEYLRVLESGDLIKTDALLKTAEESDEYTAAVVEASREYKRRNGGLETPEQRRQIAMRLHTVVRRIDNGQSWQKRVED